MLNRVTISTLLKTVIMTLGVAVVVMLAVNAWDSWSRLSTANQAEAAANAESYLFTALYNMRIDRASTVFDLNSDRTGVSSSCSERGRPKWRQCNPHCNICRRSIFRISRH